MTYEQQLLLACYQLLVASGQLELRPPQGLVSYYELQLKPLLP